MPMTLASTQNTPVVTDELTADIQQAIYARIASQMGVKLSQVQAFVTLYDDGASIPFIARYRKQNTEGLDDVQLRQLEKSLNYERDMASRRQKILELLTTQGKLTEELSQRIENATSKLELEDIYLPYRPRRRSLAAQAKEAGLEPIALAVLNEGKTVEQALANYSVPVPVMADENSEQSDNTANDSVSPFIEKEKQIAGISAIIIEEWMQALDLLDKLRTGFGKIAQIHSKLVSEEKREVGEKYKDYFEHIESLARMPNHRLLAMLRGRQDNVLSLSIEGEDTAFIEQISEFFDLANTQPAERSEYLQGLAKKLWLEKWRPHIEHRLLTEKRLAAENAAIEIFANNLQHLLMSAPAGGKVILGVDPGIRHGVKMAVIDSTGHVAKTTDGQAAIATVYPFAPDNKVAAAKATIAALLKTYHIELIAIGNGTASRETDALIKEILAENPDCNASPVVVNESGASVYSASELASQELGELDVSIRGAVSIARRLQDPLSELVKVDPKAIGVGQYQHDVNQAQLADSLDKVTQDCVNAVGVDVNTASPAILSHIAGLNSNVAQQIVNYRNEHGAFNNREQLKNVPRLGAKTFEQAAGFLRIRGGDEPLDATGLHPENYTLVKKWLEKTGHPIKEILGNAAVLNTLDTSLLAANEANLNDPTAEKAALTENVEIKITAIKQELAKPAHDPRPDFKTAKFKEGINSISDLHEGMTLEGVVTNVTSFGCFVDVGVHQDGLIHISQMSNDFITDPLDKVKPGDIVNVRVLSIDAERKRVGFTMKTEEPTIKKSIKSDGQTNGEIENKPRHDKLTANPKTSHNRRKMENTNTTGNDKSRNLKSRDTRNDMGNNSKNATKVEVQKVGSLGALLAQAGLKKAQ